MLVEETVHTWREDLPTESSSKLFKFDKPITKDSWDTQDPPNQPLRKIEEDLNIEPREPLELRMRMVSDM